MKKILFLLLVSVLLLATPVAVFADGPCPDGQSECAASDYTYTEPLPPEPLDPVNYTEPSSPCPDGKSACRASDYNYEEPAPEKHARQTVIASSSGENSPTHYARALKARKPKDK